NRNPFVPSVNVPEVRPLCSAGITRFRRYYEPLRHRRDRAWPSRVARCGCRRCRHRFPVLHVHSFDTCHRSLPRWIGKVLVAGLPSPHWPSPPDRWVGFHIKGFEVSSSVHLRYGLYLCGATKWPFPSKAPTGSLPPPPLRLLLGKRPFPDGTFTR